MLVLGKCHLLFFTHFSLIRRVAAVSQSLAVTHSLRKTSSGHLSASTEEKIITAADGGFFLWAHYHRIRVSFFCINLLLLTYLRSAFSNVTAAYRVGFFAFFTHKVPISLSPSAVPDLNVCRIIDIHVGKKNDKELFCWDGKVSRSVFTLWELITASLVYMWS